METGSYAVVLAVVAVAGVTVHEACHYAVCRLVGAEANPTYGWGRWFPYPAIATNVREHTPVTYFVTCLSPLAVFVPSAIGLVFLAPAPTSTAFGVGVMWCLAVFPSGDDWLQAYHVEAVADHHAVWFGEHAGHAAAEGIA